MTYFLKNGNTFRVSSKEAMDLHETLPAGNYVIKQDAFGNLFLEQIDSFEIKGKLYGNTLRHTDRILNTFNSRPAATGVMLTGEKGSGKTLLSKNLAIVGAQQGIPTIVINAPWHGDKFNSLIQSIDQACIIIFDEFEKVYDEEGQEALLTLLDGVFPSKKLFVLTCNDKWKVDRHMRNRPGRIFYMIDFKGLNSEFIREYCEDNMNDKQHIERMVQIAGTFDEFNFDMLKATVEEMNRYNESPQEAMAMLNAKPEYSGNSTFTVSLYEGDVLIEEKDIDGKEWEGNPLQRHVGVNYRKHTIDEDGEPDWNWESARFEPTDLKKIEGEGNIYVFTNSNGQRAVLSKVRQKTMYYHDAF